MAEDPVPRYEPFADRIVREAIERGEFDNLPGKGSRCTSNASAIPIGGSRTSSSASSWIMANCAGSGEIAGTAENS